MDYQGLANSLKVIAEPNQLQILEMLSCGEMYACDILENFDFTQPTLSHHMKVLEKEELVHVAKEGRWRHYSLDQGTAALLINGLSKTLSSTEGCICEITNKQCWPFSLSFIHRWTFTY